MYTVAVDIGGTFTDVIVLESATGRAFAGKSLTTPTDLQQGVLDGEDWMKPFLKLNIQDIESFKLLESQVPLANLKLSALEKMVLNYTKTASHF